MVDDKQYNAQHADLIIQSGGYRDFPAVRFRVHSKVLAVASKEFARLNRLEKQRFQQEERTEESGNVGEAGHHVKACAENNMSASVKAGQSGEAELTEGTNTNGGSRNDQNRRASADGTPGEEEANGALDEEMEGDGIEEQTGKLLLGLPLIKLDYDDDVLRVLLAAAYNNFEDVQLSMHKDWRHVLDVWKVAVEYGMVALRGYAQMVLMCVTTPPAALACFSSLISRCRAMSTYIPTEAALQVYAAAKTHNDDALSKHFEHRAAKATASDMFEEGISADPLCTLVRPIPHDFTMRSSIYLC